MMNIMTAVRRITITREGYLALACSRRIIAPADNKRPSCRIDTSRPELWRLRPLTCECCVSAAD